ncbi:2573_t:CDS:1, partial [Entrophospora sp. SA101]
IAHTESVSEEFVWCRRRLWKEPLNYVRNSGTWHSEIPLGLENLWLAILF